MLQMISFILHVLGFMYAVGTAGMYEQDMTITPIRWCITTAVCAIMILEYLYRKGE